MTKELNIDLSKEELLAEDLLDIMNAILNNKKVLLQKNGDILTFERSM